MEEQLTPLLKKILKNYHLKQVDMSILNKYFNLFNNKKYIGKNFEKIYQDMRKNYNLDLQSLRYGYNNQNEEKTYEKLVLAVINEADLKKRIKLIPLIIYLDSNRILYNFLYKLNYFNSFISNDKGYIIKTIESSGIEISNIDTLPSFHYEKELFKNYRKGIKNLNFQQIYSFIRAIERGIGYKFDEYLNFLVFLAYKYFFNDLIKIANNKKDMLEVIYFINILDIEERLNLALKSNNYLLKFEAIRKTVYFKSNNSYCLNLLKNERKLLSSLIIQISNNKDIWKQFLNFYLEDPLRSIQLFELMSIAILKIENSSFFELIKAIRINNHLDDNSKHALNSLIFNIKR